MISSPAACSERIGRLAPRTRALHEDLDLLKPVPMPLRAAASAVTCAAKGVDLREPLKPAPPADSHAITLPSRSVRGDDRVVERVSFFDVRWADL